jgi:1,4-dihydroxy-2-naphthoyl-CoA synthase
LNSTLFHELNAALRTLSTDDSTGAVVLTGSDKAFAAGADIKEMKDKQFAEVYKGDFLAHWTELSSFRKPIVAAVSGYAVSSRDSLRRRLCATSKARRCAFSRMLTLSNLRSLAEDASSP